VNWYDATNYCGKLTASERAAGKLPAGWVSRLPTEAEWEYACRAGTSTAFHYGPELQAGMANFSRTGLSGLTLSVGMYLPNALGLYDMHGNVMEWCSDWYGAYPSGSVTNPSGESDGTIRVKRGGSWQSMVIGCRSAHRHYFLPTTADRICGFRPVLAPAP
jgi:sulfatase modifying factor 1